jgi:hypothetical protein
MHELLNNFHTFFSVVLDVFLIVLCDNVQVFLSAKTETLLILCSQWHTSFYSVHNDRPFYNHCLNLPNSGSEE